MNLRYITINLGYKEFDTDKIFKLSGLSEKVEFAIPGNSDIIMSDTKWHNRVSDLLSISANVSNPLNIAFHLEKAWCAGFCCGAINQALSEWFNIKNKKTGDFVIKRWQASYGFPIKNNPEDDKNRNVYPEKIARLIKRHPGREYIFGYSYGDEFKKEIVTKLDTMNIPFSLVYNNYGGDPFSQTNKWVKPIMNHRSHGFSGKITPGNLFFNLNSISELVPENFGVWIDTRGLTLDSHTGKMNFNISQAFVKNTMMWLNKYNSK